MGEESFEVTIPIPGSHMVLNALAATAVAMAYNLTAEEIKRGIESLKPVKGRFRLIDTDKLLIVDDCYNANPMSMKASLEVLQNGLGRRVAILGDMGELGENEKQFHREVGSFAAHLDLEKLICVGSLSKEMADAALQEGTKLQVQYVPDRETLLSNLPSYLQKGDTVLVKASHFMKFDEIIEALKEY
jgi:UDP-N-acetylmuramoyl-tripeptide--D-alanyl-D-alanine ligase